MRISGENNLGIGLALALAVGTGLTMWNPEGTRVVGIVMTAASSLGLVALAANHAYYAGWLARVIPTWRPPLLPIAASGDEVVKAPARVVPEIFFDANDPQCFQRKPMKSGRVVRWHAIGVRNTSATDSIDDLTAVLDDTPYARDLHFAVHLRGDPEFPVVLAPRALHPKSADYFTLVGLSDDREEHFREVPDAGPYPHIITVRVCAKGLSDAAQAFLIDPAATPSVRAVSPSEIRKLYTRQIEHGEARE